MHNLLYTIFSLFSFGTTFAQTPYMDPSHNLSQKDLISESSTKSQEEKDRLETEKRHVREIIMLQGEIKNISFFGDRDIHVSRRGIIDLFQVSEKDWNIVALRTGIVTISSDTGKSKKAFVIKVLPPSNITQNRDEDSLPIWICETKGAECDHQARIIKGIWDDSARFNQARRWCLENHCLFQATLSQLIRDKLKKHFQELLGQSTSVEIFPSGLVTVHSNCQKYIALTQKINSEQLRDNARLNSFNDEEHNEIRKIIGQEIDEDQLSFRCHTNAIPQSFRLETKILKISASEMKALGFSPTNSLKAKISPFHLDADLTSRLESSQRQRNFENVGEPALRLVVGRPAVLRAGGEFPVSTPNHRGFSAHTSWKPYGLVLKATVLPITSTQVRLIYNLELKNRESDHVSIHAVEGDLNLSLGKPMIGAALDMQASDRERVTQPFLANLPILGPLFCVDYDSESESHLFAWFKVSQDDSEELRDAKTDWPSPGVSR